LTRWLTIWKSNEPLNAAAGASLREDLSMSLAGTRDTTVQSTEARIGQFLKELREKLGFSLRTVATRAGFSASFLSQLENGQVSPSIASLERIAGELGVSLADLFEASQTPTPAVVRADARPGFTSMWSRARVELLTPSGERRAVAAIAVSLAPGGASGKHSSNHPTDQFGYVLAGTIVLFLGEDRMSLDTGDTVTIPRKTPHRWQNDGVVDTQVLLVSLRLFQ
jgi:transcriptional regulator with XRE-family HTH domain